MVQETKPSRRWLANMSFAVMGMAIAGSSAWAAAGSPLPRCAPDQNAMYVLRYSSPGGGDRSFVALGTVALGSPPMSTATDTPVGTSVNPSTVAAGMRPQDGYIYAIRAASEDAYDSPTSGGSHDYRNDHRGLQVLKYGQGGVDNLGQIVDSSSVPPGTILGYSLQGLSNLNAADINPSTGELIAGNVRSGSYINGGSQLSRLLRIDVTKSPPELVGVIQLSPEIPAGASGDFAIDAAGAFAYGVARPSGGASTFWKADLATGAVTSVPLAGSHPSFGGAALLSDGSLAFYSNEGVVARFDTNGEWLSTAQVTGAESSDGARCLPEAPSPDNQPAAIPTLGQWAFVLLSLGVVGGYWRRRRV